MLGLLTGHPGEEVNSFGRDLLTELLVVHERARKAMKNMIKALWPTEAAPDDMAELANHFKGARRWFELWKISACREGAREAWAMVKTHFRKLELDHMARVGPVGPESRKYLYTRARAYGGARARPPRRTRHPDPTPNCTKSTPETSRIYLLSPLFFLPRRPSRALPSRPLCRRSQTLLCQLRKSIPLSRPRRGEHRRRSRRHRGTSDNSLAQPCA
jgi:hypothetical protein